MEIDELRINVEVCITMTSLSILNDPQNYAEQEVYSRNMYQKF